MLTDLFDWSEDRQFEAIHRHLDHLQEKIMTTIDQATTDLQTAVANLGTEQSAIVTAVNDLVADVAALTAAAGGGDVAAIEAAAATVNASAAALATAAGADPGPQPVVTPPAGPVVTSVTPATGSIAGGDAVVIAGTGFTGATGVMFGTFPATVFAVVSDTEIDVTSPVVNAGDLDVTVITPAGTSAVSAPADSFTASQMGKDNVEGEAIDKALEVKLETVYTSALAAHDHANALVAVRMLAKLAGLDL